MDNPSPILTSVDSRLTLLTGDSSVTVDLYSDEGLNLMAALWVKMATHFRLMYQPSWLGIPIIQLPSDIVMMQELIWNIRPDVIVECGLAHGGAAVLYASICELVGKGLVLGIDVEVRQYNRVAIQSHPLSHRIQIIEGSSIAPETVNQVKARTASAGTVMVVLDSNHSRNHVGQELALYHELVTPGSYLVVMDGAQAYVSDIPGGKPEWREDNPLAAIHEFLRSHPDFRPDAHFTRMLETANPDGFLRRLTTEELARP